MKLAIISHSAVALRQQIFYRELAKHGCDVFVLAPKRWGYQECKSVKETSYEVQALDVRNEGDMNGYYFPTGFKYLKKFNPDILYLQQEPFHCQTMIGINWAKILGAKVVVFTWQNIPYKVPSLDVDCIIAGNQQAAEIHGTNVVIPQVGVCTETFNIIPHITKGYDLIFTGRHTPEKGVYVIEEAIRDLDVKILWGHEHNFSPYEKMPLRYNTAKIHLAPSIDQPHIKEQSGPYTNIEALACGLYCITSNSASIVEWIGGCPGVKIIEQNNPKQLRESIIEMLSKKWKPNLPGREWVKQRFSKEYIARQLISVLEGI